MVERNLNHHGGKWSAGNCITISDFVLASYIGNFIMNPENPLSPMLKPLCDETPKFKAYCANVMQEFVWLKKRGNVGAF